MRKKKAAIACDACESARPGTTQAERLAEIGVTMVVLLAAYQLGKQFELFSFATSTENVVGLGSVFLIGLTASTSSCLAMVGGLLLSVTATWDKAHPHATRWQKFAPQLHFNAGRIIGYLFFGGLTGLLGRSLILSVKATGLTKIVLSLVMIYLGLSILGLIPKRYCRLPLPSGITKKFRTLSESDSVIAPFTLGSLTYFVPCGFTQSMQLLALGSGSFGHGALIMVVFALGTLPSLLGIGALSSFSGGRLGKVFLTVAGSVSVLLGFSNLQSGLSLSDINVPHFVTTASATNDPNVTIDVNGQQVISVEVRAAGYSANSFTIQAGKPTWIYATDPQPLSGCISSMTIPTYNISQPIKLGQNWIGPITPTRDFAFMCSMGMFRADVHVQS